MLSGCAHAPLLASAVLFLVGCVSTALNRYSFAVPVALRPIAIGSNATSVLDPVQLHAPYVGDSFRRSKYYNGLCTPENGCKVDSRNASAVASRPACTSETLKGWDGAGAWYRDEDGHYSWEPNQCRLRRLTAPQARQCLNRKKLVFIGDSISRYIYSTLVHFLSREVWPERYGGQKGGRSVVIGREFVVGKTTPDVWPRMYNYTSALFSSASNARAWESCDCERNVKEERVFHLDSFAVPNQSSGGFLSASFKFIGPNYLNESVSALRAAVQDFGVSGNDGGWVQFHIGLWNRKGLSERVNLQPILQEAVSAMQQLLPAAGPRPLLLWRSTTSTSTPKQDAMYSKASGVYKREAAAVPPWRLWDVRALTEQAQRQGMRLRWDDKHYLAVAYEEMCNLLLNMLCDTDLQFVGQAPEAAADA